MNDCVDGGEEKESKGRGVQQKVGIPKKKKKNTGEIEARREFVWT